MANTNLNNLGVVGGMVYSNGSGMGGAGGGNLYANHNSGGGGSWANTVTKSYVDNDSTYNHALTFPRVDKQARTITVTMDDGSVEYVERDELVKYIGERKLRETHEVVRTQWDRYQVAVKIVGSTDNGQEDQG